MDAYTKRDPNEYFLPQSTDTPHNTPRSNRHSNEFTEQHYFESVEDDSYEDSVEEGFHAKNIIESYEAIFHVREPQYSQESWWEDFEKLHAVLFVEHIENKSKNVITCHRQYINPQSVGSKQDLDNLVQSTMKITADPLNNLYYKIEPFYSICSEDFKEHITKDSSEPAVDYSPYFLEPKEENIHPIYRPINNAYAQNIKCLWSQSELLPLIKIDTRNYAKLHKYAKFKLKQSTMWITISDGIVNEEINTDVYNILPDPYSKLVIRGVVPHIEGVHQIFYSTLESIIIDSGLTPQERAASVIAFKNELSKSDSIKKKIAWTKNHLSPITPRVIKFIALAIQEGVGFQPQFNIILAVGEKLLPGLVLGTKLVIRDENLHQINWTTISQCFKLKPPNSVVNDMVKEYIEIEDEYIDIMENQWHTENPNSQIYNSSQSVYTNDIDNKHEVHIPKDLLSLTPEIQKKSIRFQANFIVGTLLGYHELPFPEITEQPVTFLETQGMHRSVQFFEAQNADYINNDFIKWRIWVNTFCPDKSALQSKVAEVLLNATISNEEKTKQS